ncbi:hypothetical protein VTJ49DRAFT_3596 [Mycothermus thermophilus]|uniref:AAA+ ATPase domain-containing protein n=1 Tax=Humicola insolens TaxID=85995 RepID=A0ABR3VM40_HUMIN
MADDYREHFYRIPPPPPDRDLDMEDEHTSSDLTEYRITPPGISLWDLPRRAQVEWLDYERFMNCHSTEEGLAIIQVLKGHSGLGEEVAREHSRRSGSRPKGFTDLGRATTTPDKDGTTATHREPEVADKAGPVEHGMDCDNSCDDYHDGPNLTGFQLGDATVLPPPVTRPEEVISGTPLDSPNTIRHLEVFIDFIDKHIVPQWKRAAGSEQRLFRFDELWMAFQHPGELLVSNSQPRRNPIWRLHSMSTELYLAEGIVTNPMSRLNQRQPDSGDVGRLKLYAYHLNYNGESYVPVRERFVIPWYDGVQDITALPIYPLRFSGDESLKQEARRRGDAFQWAVAARHLTYDGWTVAHTFPRRGPDDATSPIASQYVNGDVIIDCVEGYKSRPLDLLGPSSWNRDPDGFHFQKSFARPLATNEVALRYYNDPPIQSTSARIGSYVEMAETIQLNEDWSQAVYDTHVLRAREKNQIASYLDEERRDVVEGDDILLLPDAVVGDLRIDPLHKSMVNSLVKSHLAKQEAQMSLPAAPLGQDIIRDKGSAVVFLLHGVPGVGKTATAEAVALANRRPLFAITCGDLGFTPREVEQGLKEIFRLAQQWNCILLLDEADIFLSRRELRDLERNALVTVFLRVLEYYSGILFLTTNRTSEIFRVNIRKLREIMAERHKMQMERKKPDEPDPPKLIIDPRSIIRFAEKYYDMHEDTPEMRWNGRQIRNAFQIAYSLAEFEMLSLHQRNRGNGTGRLDARHFQRVAQASKKFEDYFYAATEATDADRARKLRIRRDDYEDRTEGPSYDEYGLLGYRQGPQSGPSGQAYGYGLSPYSRDPRTQTDYFGIARPGYHRPGTRQQFWQDRDQVRSREQAPLAARPAQRLPLNRQFQGGDDNTRSGRTLQQQPRPPNPPGSATSTGPPGRGTLQPPPRAATASPGAVSGRNTPRVASPAATSSARSRAASQSESHAQSRQSQGRRPATPSGPQQQQQPPRHQQTPSLTITTSPDDRPTNRDTLPTASSGQSARAQEGWSKDTGLGMDELDDDAYLDDGLYDDNLSEGLNDDVYGGEGYDDGGFYGGEGSAYGDLDDGDEFLDDGLDAVELGHAGVKPLSFGIPSWLRWYKKPEYRDIREYAANVSSGRRALSPDRNSSGGIPHRLQLERILANKTCSPMSLYDFYMYLKYIEYSAENLEFYVWFKNYEAAWKERTAESKKENGSPLAASQSASSATPIQHSEGVVIDEKTIDVVDPEVAHETLNRISQLISTTALCVANSSGACSISKPSLPNLVPPKPNPNPSSSRNSAETSTTSSSSSGAAGNSELSTVISLFLLPNSPKELNIPQSLREQALADLRREPRGDPAALKPVADHVYGLLRNCSHRNFVRLGVGNGTFETVCVATALGWTLLVAGFVLVLCRSFVPFRGAHTRWEAWDAWPMWWLGMSLVLSGMRGSCFFLLLFSRRQRLPWERLEEEEEEDGGEDGEVKLKGGLKENTKRKRDRGGILGTIRRLMIFDRRVRVQERHLRILQRKIVFQSLAGGAIFATGCVALFIWLPVWRETI